MRPFRLLSLAALGWLALGWPAEAQSPAPARVAAQLGVSRAEVVRLDVPAAPGATEDLLVPVSGRDRILMLDKHSVRGDGFQVLLDDGNRLTPAQAPPVRTYRGDVLAPELPGETAGTVRASIGEGGLWAVVLLDNGERFAVQPLSSIDASAGAGLHVVYRLEDVLPFGGFCGVDLLPPSVVPAPAPTQKATGLRTAEIAADVDFPFFQQNGSNLTATLFDVENVINGVEGIYETDVGITYDLTAIVVRTTSAADPYTTSDPSGLLNEFRSQWLQTMGDIPRDVAHLFTGRNLTGSVIGIAFLNGICNNLAYGAVQSKFTGGFAQRVALSAHELGHNWSAQHCSGADCRIMCPTLGGCTGDISKFGQQAKNSISNFKASKSFCLDVLPDPIALPFTDDFESGSIDGTKWTFVKGAKVSGASFNPPSGTNALELGATGSGEFQDDEIRSVELLAAGLPGAMLRYSSEHFRVEAGEDLVVEARTNALSWLEIDRLTSDGVDQTSFVPHLLSLPLNTLHNELRVRFRTEVNDTNDTWYVDDVEVSPCATVTPYGQGEQGSSGQIAVIGTTGGLPVVGNNNFTLTVTGGSPNAIAALFSGSSQKNVQKSWGTLLVGGPNFTRTLFVLDGTGSGQVNVPVTAALAGKTRYYQFLLRDSVPGNAVQASGGLKIVFCP